MKPSFLDYDSLLPLIEKQSCENYTRTAFSFLVDGETVSASLSYGELFEQALGIAQALSARVQKGERVLVLYPTGLSFLPAFLGCLYAGVIPVVSSFSKQEKSSARLGAIVSDCEPIMVLSQSSEAGLLSELSMGEHTLEGLEVLFTDEVNGADEIKFDPARPKGTDIAFLQYTSGSTAEPRGVVISHQNLLHNLELHRLGMHLGSLSEPNAVFVSWLPHFHQMGLVSVFLLSLGVGGKTYFMPPLAFVKKPARWLQAISRFKGSIVGAPNFAYDLCCDKIKADAKKSFDLSTLKVAFVSSEPIHSETINGFSQAFAECGFEKDCFLPAYGQAENTTLITGERGLKSIWVNRYSLGSGWVDLLENGEDAEGVELVSSGPALLGQKILIVDPEVHVPRPQMHVGEIWVSGSSIAKGYWNRPELMQSLFQAQLQVPSVELNRVHWLRTGDLGFIHEVHVYVTGRRKELVIIRGRNLYPQDIERTVAESHPYLSQGRGAAFSVEKDRGEALVVIQEVTVSGLAPEVYAEIGNEIQRRVAEVYQVGIEEIVFVRRNAVPRTTSGKIARVASRENWQRNSVRAVLERVSFTDTNGGIGVTKLPEKRDEESLIIWLVKVLEDLTGLSEVDVGKSLFELGFDSMGVVDFISNVEKASGLRVPMERFVFQPTLQHLAELMSLDGMCLGDEVEHG